MVTYLACFIVCDFKERNDTTHGAVPIPVRTIARSNQFNSTQYPLEIGVKATEYYEKYFDIPYALPKQGNFLKLHEYLQSTNLNLGF
jgi:glutamyl aminopeptidase